MSSSIAKSIKKKLLEDATQGFAFPKKQKYNNQRNDEGASKLERAVHSLLMLREAAMEIRDIQLQHLLVLQDGKRAERITWRVDFAFTVCATGELAFAEAKGVEDREYRLKLKLFRKNPIGKLEIWKGDYRRPKLVETIYPKEKSA